MGMNLTRANEVSNYTLKVKEKLTIGGDVCRKIIRPRDSEVAVQLRQVNKTGIGPHS